MNSEILGGKWNEFLGEVKKMWGKLTDDDMKVAEGNVDAIKGRLTSTYGFTKERASTEVDALIKKFQAGAANVTERAKDFVADKTAPRAHSNRLDLLVGLVALSAAVAGTLPNTGFATNEAKNAVEKIEQKTRTSIYKLTDKDSLVVSFGAGSAVLSESEKKRIRALIEANRQNKNAMDLTLAAWSDKDFIKAGKGATEARSADEKLAAKRIDAIKTYLKAQKYDFNVEQEYNMAKEPSAIASFLGTQDAVVKENVVKDGKTDSVAMNKDIEMLKDEGGANKAVIALPAL